MKDIPLELGEPRIIPVMVSPKSIALRNFLSLIRGVVRVAIHMDIAPAQRTSSSAGYGAC